MSLTLLTAMAKEMAYGEQRFVLEPVTWDAYLKISEALDDQFGLRTIYCDGRLAFEGRSHRYDWFAERLSEFIKAMARGLGIAWEDGGRATYRREIVDAGLEGDKTFYFGDHAVKMRGPLDIDLDAQPPPDLAVEVEVSHSADAALVAWGRLGVPEVWKFQPKTWEFTFCLRAKDGTYSSSERSLTFPALTHADVEQQLVRANDLGADRWNQQLEGWARCLIGPRRTGGV